MHSKPSPRINAALAPMFAALLLCLVAAPASRAEMCALDVVPAATLLLPYFEVDLDDLDNPNNLNTFFTINNASSEPTLAHVTFWTDYAIPTLDFDIFLTGYDVQVVELRLVFAGSLPVTADEQTDPLDLISPHGLNPEWDGSFTAPPNCENFFPFDNPVIPGQNLDRLVNGHTGRPISVTGKCAGSATGDNIARGYITIDNARRCSIEFPNYPGYFGGLDPVAVDENWLWGDFLIQNPSQGLSVRDSLVHIEADPSFDGSTTSSGYTFYGSYTGGLDHREPLSTQWGARYMTGDSLATDLIIWRDPTTSIVEDSGYECGQSPPWEPLQQTSVLCFNEQEDFNEVCNGPGDACFPLATQRTQVDAGDFTTPFESGWCLLDLTHDDSFEGDVDFPSEGSPLAQSYVFSVFNQAAEPGGLSVSTSRAVSLGSACTLPTSFSDIFADGFESGGTSNWSATQP